MFTVWGSWFRGLGFSSFGVDSQHVDLIASGRSRRWLLSELQSPRGGGQTTSTRRECSAEHETKTGAVSSSWFCAIVLL